MSAPSPQPAIDIQARLKELQLERMRAASEGHAGDGAYMAELDHEIAATSVAYVGTAVTEIATLRAELSGPQLG